jgi:hypothetical protein
MKMHSVILASTALLISSMVYAQQQYDSLVRALRGGLLEGVPRRCQNRV